jgi:hypothetical protein
MQLDAQSAAPPMDPQSLEQQLQQQVAFLNDVIFDERKKNDELKKKMHKMQQMREQMDIIRLVDLLFYFVCLFYFQAPVVAD